MAEINRRFGATALDGVWTEIPEGGEGDYRFFKVTVEMP